MKKISLLFAALALSITLDAATVQTVQKKTYYVPDSTTINAPSNQSNLSRYPSNYIQNDYNPYYDYDERDNYQTNYPVQGQSYYPQGYYNSGYYPQYYSYPDQGYYYNRDYVDYSGYGDYNTRSYNNAGSNTPTYSGGTGASSRYRTPGSVGSSGR